MNANLPALAYAAYGFLIIFYAWTRSTSATQLGFVLLVYVVFGHLVAAGVADIPAQHNVGPMATSKIANVQMVTVGLSVWLSVRHGFSAYASDDPPNFPIQVMYTIIAISIGAVICLTIHAIDRDPLAGAGHDFRNIIFSFPLCAAVTFFRDCQRKAKMAPTWIRRAETFGCNAVMALSIALLYLFAIFPLLDVFHGWRLGAMLVTPSALALVIGGSVPQIYRTLERRTRKSPW
jgi:hypothetical protein